MGKRFEILLDPRILLALAFAVFIGYYPYFQNPPWLVGTDAGLEVLRSASAHECARGFWGVS